MAEVAGGGAGEGGGGGGHEASAWCQQKTHTLDRLRFQQQQWLCRVDSRRFPTEFRAAIRVRSTVSIIEPECHTYTHPYCFVPA